MRAVEHYKYEKTGLVKWLRENANELGHVNIQDDDTTVQVLMTMECRLEGLIELHISDVLWTSYNLTPKGLALLGLERIVDADGYTRIVKK